MPDETQGQIPDEIRESVAINNIKTLGESAAFYTQLAMGNAVSHQNRLNVIAETTVGQICKALIEVDPSESVAIQKLLSGNDLAQQLAQLLAALASNQQGVKAAQTTPPVTP